MSVQFMRKMREFELKKIENEINIKKSMNINNTDKDIYFCQKVFENSLQLEVEKAARKIENIKMLNDMKLEEKSKYI